MLYSRLSNSIQNAVHFALPDGGYIFDDKFKGLDGFELRLPYPKLTIEFVPQNSETGKALADKFSKYGEKVTSTKSLILVNEIDGDKLNSLREMIEKDSTLKKIANLTRPTWFDTAERVIQCVPFAGFKNLSWTPVPTQIILDSNWTNAKDMRAFFLPTDRELLFEHKDPEYVDFILNSSASYCISVLEFLEALTCKNVKQSIHQEVRKNNDKWVRLGKLPMYETKVLTIDTTEKEYIGSSGGSGRSHASPRQHLRRGHIRQLESGNIWVNSCVVGSAENGRLDKSYKVK